MVEVSPFEAVVRNRRIEVFWIVRRRWIRVSGPFGKGKDTSMGRPADVSSFAIVQYGGSVVNSSWC